MVHKSQTKPNLTPLPSLRHEILYIGVVIGKFQHVAGFLSPTLLARHERFEGRPTLSFVRSREGLETFLDRVRELVPLSQLEKDSAAHRKN